MWSSYNKCSIRYGEYYKKSMTMISGGQQKRTFIILVPSPLVTIKVFSLILNRPFAYLVPEAEGTISAP